MTFPTKESVLAAMQPARKTVKEAIKRRVTHIERAGIRADKAAAKERLKTAEIARQEKMTIRINDVFLPRDDEARVSAQFAGHRRVIYVIANLVIYSTGGDHNAHCSVPTFKKWAGRKIHEGTV